ncbi:MAG TPA: TIGR02584 family CRISPR-associated protein, partial [bacterium]|nr:TIGR02584 family CRISPR-associated protein [bacterium]
PPVYYDEIFIITTKIGKNILTEKLINSNVFKEMCTDIKDGPATLSLDKKCIVVPKYDDGEELTDIKTTLDNQIMANFITSFIKRKAVDSASRLHAFLSGGRKTMSFYMGLAMELYSRSWDKTYHILISPEFESNRDFYYKPDKNRKIKCGDKILDTKNCEINLIELPLFKLRNKIKMNFSDFSSAIKYGQREIDTAIAHPNIVINLYDRTIKINPVESPDSINNMSNGLRDTGMNIKLSPMQLMIYATYLKIKLYNCKYSDREYCIDCTECFPSLLDLSTKPALEEMAKIYKIINPSRVDILLYNYKEGLSMDILRQSISKIKKEIYDSLNDETLSSFCAISASNKNYGNTRHGVRIEKSKITIKPII